MNVCVVCLDALRVDHVTPEIMPNLSALLATGRQYTNVYCKVPWTPTSAAAMLLGDNDAFGRGPDGTVGMPSIAGRLHGTHSTGAFLGQATFATAQALWPFRDFDYVWSCGERVHSTCLLATWEPYYMEGVWSAFEHWVDNLPEARPWFAYIHLFEVHEPYLDPEQYGRWPAEWLDDGIESELRSGHFSTIMERQYGHLHLSDKSHAYLRARYEAYCHRADRDIMGTTPHDRRLKALRNDDSTIVILTSDHGDNHGDGGIWGHGTAPCYQTEAACKVLLGIIGPGIEPHEIRDRTTNASLPGLICGVLQEGAKRTDLSATEQGLRALGYAG